MLVVVESMKNAKTLDRDSIKDEITKMRFTKGSSMPEIAFDQKGFVITKEDAFIVKGVQGGEFVEVR